MKGIYATIIDVVNNDKGGMFFVYGYGGTGKTYLYKTLIASLRSNKEIVLNVASSGIAALLLEGGRTAHSRFAIPINVVEESICSISVDSDLEELLRMAKLIIWDEAPMMNIHCFEAFDRKMRDIVSSESPSDADKVFG
jgi:ATP-dependent DNA helicase PIF1